MSQRVAKAILLSSIALLAQGCALEPADDALPAPLAQQGAIDGSVRVSPTHDGGSASDDAGAPPAPADDDAGPAVPSGPPRETVTLPDGGIIVLDPACPDRELFGNNAIGCCRSGKCGLSNHELTLPGVSRECQSYADLRAFDDDFDLPDKTCRAGP